DRKCTTDRARLEGREWRSVGREYGDHDREPSASAPRLDVDGPVAEALPGIARVATERLPCAIARTRCDQRSGRRRQDERAHHPGPGQYCDSWPQSTGSVTRSARSRPLLAVCELGTTYVFPAW